jgi:hypothetical protein
MTAVSFGLVVTEALLGGLVVRSDLVATFVLVHLGIATALFGLLLMLALLANFRELPTRWVAWARRAIEENPAPTPTDYAPDPVPFPSDPTPAAYPREG